MLRTISWIDRAFRSAGALALIGIVAGNLSGTDNEERAFAIYYLSPRVLTRTNMTPKGLKSDTFRLHSDNLPISQISRVYEIIHSAGHNITQKSASGYDFRLCISSDDGDIFFNRDNTIAFTHSGSFALSASEEVDARKLFDELDSLVPTKVNIHEKQ